MTLMFKKNVGNQSHSLVLQKRSTITSSNASRRSPSQRHRHHHGDSIKSSKKTPRQSAVSSIQIRLPPATEKEKTCNDGLRRSLRVREKTLHLYEVKKDRDTQKQSTKRKSCPNFTCSSPKITRRMVSKTIQGSSFFRTSTMDFKSMDLTPVRRKSHTSSAIPVDEATKQKSPINSAFPSLNYTKRIVPKTTQDSSFFHTSTMDFKSVDLTPVRRKSHTSSDIQIAETTKQKSPINSGFPSLNYTRTIVPKTTQCPSFQHPNKNWIPPTRDEYIFSNTQADENIYRRFANVYPSQVALSFTQQRQSIPLFYPDGFLSQDKTFQSNNFYHMVDSLDRYCDNCHQNLQKEAAKRKWCLNSTSSLPKFMRRMVSKTTQGSNFNLDSMVSTPLRRKSLTSSPTQLINRNYPKFASVDPSQVASGLFQQEIIIKTSASGNVISLFNLDAWQVESYQNIVYSSNEKGTPQYKFKKETVDLQYLSKKYTMMDPFTLDKCYGLCNCNIRKTEIMLLDVLAGKEVFPPPEF